MLLPIISFGHNGLREETKDITADYPNLKELIANMFETMYHANGVGLAAPQVNIPIRLFVVDASPLDPIGDEVLEGFKKVFINPLKLTEQGEEWPYEEGCLSIPDIRGDVNRPPQLKIRYMDEQFEEHIEIFTGINARVIQHEYDHIDGVLFTEHLKPIKRRLVRRKLDNIRKGKISVDYKMKFVRK